MPSSELEVGKGILRNAENGQWVICGKCFAECLYGTKGKMWNDTLRKMAEITNE